jgi:nicotinamide mononucleotide (NMN) deamidase PncC
MMTSLPPSDDQLQAAARQLGDALRQRGWRIATAESCTGGLIGHAITAIPGSSDYYVGGVICDWVRA